MTREKNGASCYGELRLAYLSADHSLIVILKIISIESKHSEGAEVPQAFAFGEQGRRKHCRGKHGCQEQLPSKPARARDQVIAISNHEVTIYN